MVCASCGHAHHKNSQTAQQTQHRHRKHERQQHTFSCQLFGTSGVAHTTQSWNKALNTTTRTSCTFSQIELTEVLNRGRLSLNVLPTCTCGVACQAVLQCQLCSQQCASHLCLCAINKNLRPGCGAKANPACACRREKEQQELCFKHSNDKHEFDWLTCMWLQHSSRFSIV